MFENYLIHPKAIVALLSAFDFFNDKKISESEVINLLIHNWQELKKETDSQQFDPADQFWLSEIHGANLLKNIISELTEQKYQNYDKILNGKWLVDWILENDPDHLKVLADELFEIVK
jgi:hypothetical protein